LSSEFKQFTAEGIDANVEIAGDPVPLRFRRLTPAELQERQRVLAAVCAPFIARDVSLQPGHALEVEGADGSLLTARTGEELARVFAEAPAVLALLMLRSLDENGAAKPVRLRSRRW
jgi:hypothetical protein